MLASPAPALPQQGTSLIQHTTITQVVSPYTTPLAGSLTHQPPNELQGPNENHNTGTATPAQILQAYCQALLAISTAHGITELHENAAALQSAFTDYAGNDQELLHQIETITSKPMQPSPAVLSFAAQRLYAYALRCTMRHASPVLGQLIGRLTATQQTATAAWAPQSIETSAHIRRLTFIVRLHATILADCEQSGPSRDKLHHIITQLSNLANALEEQNS